MLAVVLFVEALEHGLGDVGLVGGVHDVAAFGGPQDEGVALLTTVLLEVGVYLGHHGLGQALVFTLGLLLDGLAVAQQLLLLGGAGGGGGFAQGLQLGAKRVDAQLPIPSFGLK